MVVSEEALWTAVVMAAEEAGLDPAKFGAPQRQVVAAVADFLAQPPATPRTPSRFPRVPQPVKAVARPFVGRFLRPAPQPSPPPPPQPLILCGLPGTGKTTFTAVLDAVLRTQFGLPDPITPQMSKRGDQHHPIAKRLLNGKPLSLLAVSKWAELLHFVAWDVQKHRFVAADLAHFGQTILAPMRVIFADEVELTGYAPVLPQMAHYGLLIIGTSNQAEFPQLDHEQLPPRLIAFGGADMRAGDPLDAAVTSPSDPAWTLFEQATAQPTKYHGRLPYHVWGTPSTTYLAFDFRRAAQAPLLTSDWIQLLQAHGSPLTLLLDDFSLEWLRTDYNSIIRFVGLLDGVEQLGVGVLVRQAGGEPAAVLSREALSHMQVTIQSARGVSQEIKTRTTIGLGRCTSRLGQAGHRGRALLH